MQTANDFDDEDLVEFVGWGAEELRAKQWCTTGVVKTLLLSDPRVRVELDTEENSGKGGGPVLLLVAFNWPIIGVPIRISQKGWKWRHFKSFQLRRTEMLERPVEQRNPKFLARYETRIAQYSQEFPDA